MVKNPRVLCLFHRGFKIFPRGYKQIESLSNDGYDVKVLCVSRSNLPQSVQHEGVEIQRIRVPWPDFAPLKPFFLSWVLLILLFQGLSEERVDICHCFGIYSLIPGIIVSKFKSSSLTYDAFEDYRYQFEHSGAIPIATDILGQGLVRIERWLALFAEMVFVVPSADDILEQRFEDIGTPVKTIWNVPRISEGIKAKEGNDNSDNQITVLYVGSISERKGSQVMIQAAIQTLEQTNEPVNFIIVGGRSTKTAHELDQMIPSNLEDQIEFPGFIPYNEVRPFLETADIAIELNQPTFWNRQSKASSKLFRYMAAQLPIVISDFPGFREIINETHAGKLVNPTDPVEASGAIIDLVENEQKRNTLGRNGYNSFLNGYNWDIEQTRFLEAFESTILSK